MKLPTPTVIAALGTTILVLLTGCGSGDGQGPATASAPDIEVAPAVAAACTAEASPTIAAIAQRGTLQWATGIAPPFTYKDGTGAYIGVEPDNAAELAAILGVDLQITEYGYDLLPPAVQTGKADIIGAQLFDTPTRREAINFTDPYFLSGQLFYVDTESPFQTIADLDAPANTFAYFTGMAQIDVADKYIPDAQRVAVAQRGQPIPFDMIAGGRATSAMTEAALMKLLLGNYRNPRLAAIGLRGRVTTERAEPADIIDPFEVAFGYSRSADPGWTQCLNTWVADLVTTGRMDQRVEDWSAKLENGER